MSDTQLMTQIAPYQPWLIIAAVFVLFFLLRLTRRELRRRVNEIGYGLMGEEGWRIWFWLNAPGVILHELCHAAVILIFTPFGFRITNISFFHMKRTSPRRNGRLVRNGGRQSLQLGEVQYTRTEGRFITYIGDGLSGIAPLLGGIAMFAFLYWVATGYSLWDMPFDANWRLQLLRPGWPWWTLIFAPYLILTVTSELWPSRQDWYGARWLVRGLIVIIVLTLGAIWYFHRLNNLITFATVAASHMNFALIILLVLDMLFLIVGEVLARALRR